MNNGIRVLNEEVLDIILSKMENAIKWEKDSYTHKILSDNEDEVNTFSFSCENPLLCADIICSDEFFRIVLTGNIIPNRGLIVCTVRNNKISIHDSSTSVVDLVRTEDRYFQQSLISDYGNITFGVINKINKIYNYFNTEYNEDDLSRMAGTICNKLY